MATGVSFLTSNLRVHWKKRARSSLTGDCTSIRWNPVAAASPGCFAKKSGRQIGGSEFLILNQQFNTLIKAGLPILKSLDLLATRASAPKLRPVISQIRDPRPGREVALRGGRGSRCVFQSLFDGHPCRGEEREFVWCPGLLHCLSAREHGGPQENSGHPGLPRFIDQRCDHYRDLSGHRGDSKVCSALPAT